MSARGLFRKLDNVGAGKIILPGDCGHVGEAPEEDAGREGPDGPCVLAGDEEKPAAKFPLRRLLDKDRLNSLTHSHALPDSPTERADAELSNLSPSLTQINFTPHAPRDVSGAGLPVGPA